MSQYVLDREQAAEILSVSTRTVDRYVRSGKIRSRRIGKKIYLHDDDVRRLSQGGFQEWYEIVSDGLESESSTVRQHDDVVFFDTKPVRYEPSQDGLDYKTLYEDAKEKIDEKDRIIQDLSYRYGQAESDLKNSIPLLEYKKATFLLESAKSKGFEEKASMQEELDELRDRFRRERSAQFILLAAIAILVLAVLFLWFKALK